MQNSGLGAEGLAFQPCHTKPQRGEEGRRRRRRRRRFRAQSLGFRVFPYLGHVRLGVKS